MFNGEREFVVEAIKINNLEDVLIIQDTAFISGGKIKPDSFSLHIYTTKVDLEPFWKTFNKLQNNNKVKEITMDEKLR